MLAMPTQVGAGVGAANEIRAIAGHVTESAPRAPKENPTNRGILGSSKLGPTEGASQSVEVEVGDAASTRAVARSRVVDSPHTSSVNPYSPPILPWQFPTKR
jgi:hypothetical protein